MNIPITSRVKRAGKKGCGCGCDCKCGKAPAKKLTDLSGDGKVTQKDVLIGRGVIEAPAVPKMWGPAKRKYGAKAVAQKHCY
jgi:hypothetical protein